MKIGKVFGKLSELPQVKVIEFGEKEATVTLKSGWLSGGNSVQSFTTAHFCRLFIEAAVNPDVEPVKRGRPAKVVDDRAPATTSKTATAKTPAPVDPNETPREFLFAPSLIKKAIATGGDFGTVVSETEKKVKMLMTKAQAANFRVIATQATMNAKSKQSGDAAIHALELYA